MKIYRCVERLVLPRLNRQGEHVEDMEIQAGTVFTAEEGQRDPVRMESTNGLRAVLSRATINKYFEELA